MADPLDTRLMLVPRERVATLHSPGVPASTCQKKGCTVHTSDWRFPPGSPENLHRVCAEPTVTLRELFERPWNDRSLCSGYAIVRDGVPLGRVPRVAKEALKWLRSQGFDVVLTCMFADVDTPGHVDWTEETLRQFEHTWATAPSLQTCAAYPSARGYHALQPLATPIPVDEAEPRLHAWLHQLVAEGVWATALECKDWGHLMRVPRCRRGDGTLYVPPWLSLERARAIEPPPPLASEARRLVRHRRPVAGGTVLPIFGESVPGGWAPVADTLGAAIRDHVRDRWRACYLALSGALAERGCPLSGLPAVVARAHSIDQSYPGWDALLTDRVAIARDTAARFARGEVVAGYAALRREHPRVADALDHTTVPAVIASVHARLAASAPEPASAETAVARITEVLDTAVGVTLVAGPPGLGKTRGVLDRALRLPVIGQRAAPGSRMGLASPHHKLALQVRADAPDRSARLFGPLAHRTGGEPTCIHHEAAAPLADGAQSVEWEFCQGRGKAPCERANTCPARLGREGPDNATLVVGPHELLDELGGAAGVAGLLVVDEPEGVVASETLTLDQLDTARRYLDAFVLRYARAIAPALAALDAWTRTLGPTDETLHSLPDAIRGAVGAIPSELLDAAGIDPTGDLGGQVLEQARGAILAEARSKSPPVRWMQMVIARRSPGRAHELGAASRVLHLLWRGLTESPHHAARIDTRRGDRSLVLTGIDPRVVRALTRPGPTVLLGADVALHRPAIAKVLGYEPALVDLRVGDGAPIARTIYATRSATRARWCPGGVPAWEAFLSALRLALAWADEVPVRRLALISWAALTSALGHTLDPADPTPRAQWRKAHRSDADLDAARLQLEPVLAPWRGRAVVGHYGGLRGLNHMKDADALVTLGDPRPNLGEVEDQALYLGLDAGGRADDLAEAELEQAHGRLRTIHRTAPGRLLHIGALVNPGWRGLPVDVREVPGGRPRGATTVDATRIRTIRAALKLSQLALAVKLRISLSALKHYEAGRAPAPPEVAAALIALDPVGSETPSQKGSLAGGF